MALVNQGGWEDALDRVRSARSSPILMPAAILVLLDMAVADELSRGIVPFAAFEDRFRALVSRCNPGAAGKAWQPFFHLSGRVGLWSLRKALDPAVVPPGWKPTSRAGLVGQIDAASLDPALLPSLNDPKAREALREAVYGMLEGDDKEESKRLIDAHKAGAGSSQR